MTVRALLIICLGFGWSAHVQETELLSYISLDKNSSVILLKKHALLKAETIKCADMWLLVITTLFGCESTLAKLFNKGQTLVFYFQTCVIHQSWSCSATLWWCQLRQDRKLAFYFCILKSTFSLSLAAICCKTPKNSSFYHQSLYTAFQGFVSLLFSGGNIDRFLI